MLKISSPSKSLRLPRYSKIRDVIKKFELKKGKENGSKRY